jgi:hypothetical protein
MDTPRPSDDDIRARAYELWQEEGCPTGKPDEFWFRACVELSQAEESYDNALEDSFPASDPPSHSGTTGPGR